MSQNPKYELHYGIPSENRFLIAEIFVDGEHWAELNTEAGHLQVVFFRRGSESEWRLPFDFANTVLNEAASELKRRSVFFRT
jgi:hypothetical protein